MAEERHLSSARGAHEGIVALMTSGWNIDRAGEGMDRRQLGGKGAVPSSGKVSSRTRVLHETRLE